MKSIITLVQAPPAARRQRTQFTCTGEVRTKQSFNDECNINQIMAKFQKTGIIDHINNRQPQYGDTSPQDYHQSLTIIREAEALFAELPSSVRKKFNNQPDEFLSFVQNPENEGELITMGLAQPKDENNASKSALADAKTAMPSSPSPPVAGGEDSDVSTETSVKK